ncbi:tRNA pseudouridine(55) synthase TruB [Desulforamulus hydrothermalis]|uniref:tRNA pseudouridine synthase B n=1 Tax=Desulforamulus hydrothermalis Lam5 = DSM 18033 TaxID=1121428 RepID=K8ELS4_9FIRM|nr:tRNA pseudouridine(55) synthase TruB [Desulforamulus hydrothermalis]CCO09421.1 tRNA pseudouridine synthase B [Desulforamulus hydrothermalis Lam5 = DSM 18033]SHH08516.1 tRNA pseudouridine synthase B [Desulforamulus hydrothermalis Lam5 = DSM 18033]
MDGILNILKPPGMTSHDVVQYVRKVTGIKKCGHTGTLDPGAAGVLPVCLGKATKLARFLAEGDKTYRGEITLGIATTSQDAFGEVVARQSAAGITWERLQEVFAGFTGQLKQTPPMTSAVRVQGQRLYEWERQGKIVEVPSRLVTIYQLKIIDSWHWHTPHPRILFDVTCSKGTYVRTLCSDIGQALGCGAYMSFLLRTRVGHFELAGAVTLEQLTKLAAEKNWAAAIIPMTQAVHHLPAVEVHASAIKSVTSGATLYPAGVLARTGQINPGDLVRVQADRQLLAIYKAVQEEQQAVKRLIFKPELVLVP